MRIFTAASRPPTIALLLAASTSLPELVTNVHAAVLGAVDIGVGVGDLFGSTLSNMLKRQVEAPR